MKNRKCVGKNTQNMQLNLSIKTLLKLYEQPYVFVNTFGFFTLDKNKQ